MKNVLRIAAVCSLLAIAAPLFAQMEVAPVKKAVVKMNLSSLLFKNGSFQYEVATGRKTSFALGVSYQPQTGLPFAQRLSEEFGDNPDAKRAIETTRIGGYSITPEFRFYLGKSATHGFYIAPFARYQHMDFEQIYSFTASDGKVYEPLISGGINNIGGGILFGSQWNLGRTLTLDLWLLGPIYGRANGSFSGAADFSDLSAEDRADLERDIEGVDIPLTTIDANVGSNKVDVKISGPYIGLRALGLTIGVRI